MTNLFLAGIEAARAAESGDPAVFYLVALAAANAVVASLLAFWVQRQLITLRKKADSDLEELKARLGDIGEARRQQLAALHEKAPALLASLEELARQAVSLAQFIRDADDNAAAEDRSTAHWEKYREAHESVRSALHAVRLSLPDNIDEAAGKQAFRCGHILSMAFRLRQAIRTQHPLFDQLDQDFDEKIREIDHWLRALRTELRRFVGTNSPPQPSPQS